MGSGERDYSILVCWQDSREGGRGAAGRRENLVSSDMVSSGLLRGDSLILGDEQEQTDRIQEGFRNLCTEIHTEGEHSFRPTDMCSLKHSWVLLPTVTSCCPDQEILKERLFFGGECRHELAP